MKKTLTAAMAIALCLSLFTTGALAGHGNGHGGHSGNGGHHGSGNNSGWCYTDTSAGSGYGSSYTDVDSDGVCDNRNTSCSYADEDGDGVCDNCSRTQKACWRDADGDGVCDNKGTRSGSFCHKRLGKVWSSR